GISANVARYVQAVSFGSEIFDDRMRFGSPWRMVDTRKRVVTWWRRLLKPAVLPLARMFVVLACLSLVTTDAWLVWKARAVRLHGAEVETSNLAAALARQAADSLKKADTILVDMVERLQGDAATPARLQRLLQRHVHELAELHGLFVYGPDGEWRVSSF